MQEANWPRGDEQAADAPLSQNEHAYRTIKREIVALRLAPGDYVNEARVGQLLGLGRTPVNHAFHRLAHEGLVQVVPRKGIIIRPLSLGEISELIEVRRLNEPHVAALAAARISDREVAALRAVLAEGESAARAGRELSMDMDRRLHALIAQAGRNAVLADIIATLHARSLRFWALSLATGTQQDHVLQEHRDIVDCIARRDPEAARHAMERHIASFRATILSRLG